MHAWVDRSFCQTKFSLDDFLIKIKFEGKIFENFDNNSSEGVGLLFFEEMSAKLFEYVDRVSKHGDVRIIAIQYLESIQFNKQFWQLIHSGVSDIVKWSPSTSFTDMILSRLQRWEEIETILHTSEIIKNKLIGETLIWKNLLRQIVEAAYCTHAPVLITGESGTGKEHIAKLIHSLDKRESKQQFVIVDCTTIVPELSGSEFFGHERGAFTGALFSRDGAFSLANGGTLFLDEVGDLPLPLQAELLRVIQEGTYKRVGSNLWQHTKFRLVCATNKDLMKEVADGRFRHDFYHRIANWKFNLPPLRDRKEDKLILTKHFINHRSDIQKTEIDDVMDKPVQNFIREKEFPGNIRELEHLINRILDRHVGDGPITIGDIPEEARPHIESVSSDGWLNLIREPIIQAISRGMKLKDIGKNAEDIAISIVEEEEKGNLRRAAERLGVTDRALQIRRASRRSQVENKNEGSYDNNRNP